MWCPGPLHIRSVSLVPCIWPQSLNSIHYLWVCPRPWRCSSLRGLPTRASFVSTQKSEIKTRHECLCGKPGAQEKENLFRWIIHHDSPWFLDILRNHTEGGKPSGPELDKEKWIHLSGLIIFAVTASVHGETQHMSPANVIGKKNQKHVPLLRDLMEVGTEYKHF